MNIGEGLKQIGKFIKKEEEAILCSEGTKEFLIAEIEMEKRNLLNK